MVRVRHYKMCLLKLFSVTWKWQNCQCVEFNKNLFYQTKMWRKDSIVLLGLCHCLTLSSRNVLQWVCGCLDGPHVVDLDFVLDLLAVAVTKYCGEQTCQEMYVLAHSFRGFILGLFGPSLLDWALWKTEQGCHAHLVVWGEGGGLFPPHTGEPPLPPWPYPSLPIAPGARGQTFTL